MADFDEIEARLHQHQLIRVLAFRRSICGRDGIDFALDPLCRALDYALEALLDRDALRSTRLALLNREGLRALEVHRELREVAIIASAAGWEREQQTLGDWLAARLAAPRQ